MGEQLVLYRPHHMLYRSGVVPDLASVSAWSFDDAAPIVCIHPMAAVSTRHDRLGEHTNADKACSEKEAS